MIKCYFFIHITSTPPSYQLTSKNKGQKSGSFTHLTFHTSLSLSLAVIQHSWHTRGSGTFTELQRERRPCRRWLARSNWQLAECFVNSFVAVILYGAQGGGGAPGCTCDGCHVRRRAICWVQALSSHTITHLCMLRSKRKPSPDPRPSLLSTSAEKHPL